MNILKAGPMAQRTLEPGQIETLAQASIPRVRLPDRESVFARRAARLRKLAAGSALGDYLQFLAALVDAQHAALAHLSVPTPTSAHLQRSGEYGMPPIHAATWPRAPQWRRAPRCFFAAPPAPTGFPPRGPRTTSHRPGGTPPPGEAPPTSLLWARDDAH